MGAGSNPSDPNASVILPPEILDKILEYIPAIKLQQPTFLACALVATWWTEPSQRRLFSLAIVTESNHERWIKGVVLSRSKTRLLGYVRSLWYHRVQSFKDKYRMRDLAQDSAEYLSALCNLRSLTVQNTWVEHISEEGYRSCFSAFRGTLTYLSLDSSVTSFSAFAALVDYFPNIRTLLLYSLTLKPDDGPVPTSSRPLRGKAHIHVQHHDLEFFDRLAELNPEYEELVIDAIYHQPGGRSLERILRISPSTVKILRLVAQLSPGVPTTISNFRQLQELELVVVSPNSAHEVFLSSITSTKLRKIIFPSRYMYDCSIFSRQMPKWDLIDEQLCGLADRLRSTGYRHTLEAELRLTRIIDPFRWYDFTTFLPKFREKGIVTVIYVYGGPYSDLLLHSSTHGCSKSNRDHTTNGIDDVY